MAEKQRLQKILSASGIASRRKAEEMIRAGRVKVNGNPVKLGDSADPERDIITLDGEAITQPGEKIYLALHKPRGFVTTMQDEKNRRCVADLVKDIPQRVYPIGRLDKDSEGLLLMTNDGAFANLVMHPSREIAKTYRVTVRPGINEEQLNRLSTGIEIDGRKTAPARVKVLEEQENRVVLEIVLTEGRNREIRRMCEALKLEVARLKRTAEGPVKLGMLKQGTYRELTPEELRILSVVSRKKGEAENDRNSARSGKGTGRKNIGKGSRNGQRGKSPANDGRRRNPG